MSLSYSSLPKNWQVSSKKLLLWYKKQPLLPWRALQNPYSVWISEVMLQQTMVKTVIGYFENFLLQFPTVFDLARASIDQVLHVWQGLGYYRRAHHMHACAGLIVQKYSGQFPDQYHQLLKLPGFGAYTAAAVASICFKQPVLAVDGNVRRVLSRYGGNQVSDFQLRHAWSTLLDHQAGDINQALMDVGRTICQGKMPKCTICPLQTECQNPALIIKTTKLTKKKLWGHVFLIPDLQGRWAIKKKLGHGLLAGLMGFPTSQWTFFDLLPTINMPHYIRLPQTIQHAFTHIDLTLYIWIRKPIKMCQNNPYHWITYQERNQYSFSTLMKKIFPHWKQNIL